MICLREQRCTGRNKFRIRCLLPAEYQCGIVIFQCLAGSCFYLFFSCFPLLIIIIIINYLLLIRCVYLELHVTDKK